MAIERIQFQDSNINSISTSYLQYNNAWIFLPESAQYLVSSDGENWQEVATVEETDPETRLHTLHRKDIFIQNFTKTGINVEARYVKVVAKNLGQCPEWHDAAGSDAWIFVDEIVVQ